MELSSDDIGICFAGDNIRTLVKKGGPWERTNVEHHFHGYPLVNPTEARSQHFIPGTEVCRLMIRKMRMVLMIGKQREMLFLSVLSLLLMVAGPVFPQSGGEGPYRACELSSRVQSTAQSRS